MPFQIFCPSSHLILSAPSCQVCGWVRPAAKIGSDAWPPNQLKTSLGNGERDVSTRPAVIRGIVAFPINNHEIVGLDAHTGQEFWRQELAAGQVTHQIVADGDRFLLSISDERPIGQAGQSQLASINVASGFLNYLWQDGGHQMSAPVLTPNHILLRTVSGLAVLSRSAQPELLRRLPLKTWFDLAPFFAGGKVYISDGNTVKNIGQLLAFDSNDYSQTWTIPTDGMLTQPILASGNFIIFQNGNSQIMAVDSANGAEIWKRDFDRLYSPPVAFNGQILCVSRIASKNETDNDYFLFALSADSGSLLWQVSLPGRVLLPPVCHDNYIYVASHNGHLLSFSFLNQEQVFDKIIASEQDPPHTELVIDDGILFSVTRKGLLTSTFVQMPVKKLLDPPTTYLEIGDFEQAAAAYAILNDYKNAASLYANQLQDVSKALVLYDCAGLYSEAAKLAASHGLLFESECFYQLAGDPVNQAEILLKRSLSTTDATLYIHQLRHAVDLFVQAGQEDSELETLMKLELVSPEHWVYERIAKLTQNTGRFFEEAHSWEKLGNLAKAAYAYQRAGMQHALSNPDDKPGILGLYQKAAVLFGDCGQEQDESNCQNLSAKIDEMPVITINCKTNSTFREGCWNILTLEVQNTGYGIAKQIAWQVTSERFDIDQTGTWSLKALGIGDPKEIKLHLRPKLGEIGEAVPFLIEWQWQSPDGRQSTNQNGASIQIRSQNGTRPKSPPINIQKQSFLSDRPIKVKRIGLRLREKLVISLPRRRP